MKAPLRELPEGYQKRLLLVSLGIGLPLVLLMWGLYLARVLWQWDPLPSVGFGGKAQSPGDYLLLAALMTFFAPIGFWKAFGRSAHLYKYGVEVAGRVTSFGIFRVHGMVPVTYEYEWLGETYTRKVDMSKDKAAKYKQDATIHLVIDPDRPKVAQESDTVFGAWLISGKKK